MKKNTLVLGSGSPRRKQLLADFYELQVYSPDIDESVFANERPLDYVNRVCREKWDCVAKKFPNRTILTADTTVCLDTLILGKAESGEQAFEMIQNLSGRQHEVITSVCVGTSFERAAFVRQIDVSTQIVFRKLSDDEISKYVLTGEWQGKAGAYGIQGSAQQFVHTIHGSLTNVIGLPLSESLELLQGLEDRRE